MALAEANFEDGQIGKQKVGPKEEWTHGWTDRHKDSRKDIQTDGQIDRKRYIAKQTGGKVDI